MSSPVSYRWQPTEDFEVSPASLAKPELRTLAQIWDEQRDALAVTEGLKLFNERLRREWSIETGLIERVYTFDRGVTQMLIERGIDASYIGQRAGTQDPDRVVAILRDHEEAIEGLFSFVKGQRRLTTSYIKELHAQLTRHQETTLAVDATGRLVEVPLLRGDYKRHPNNPQRPNGSIHQYCPPEQVASEMDRVIALHSEHSNVPPEVEAAWLHHRFTQIHPFQDGNGRVARCLATLIFIRAGYFPLVIRDTLEERTRYLDALETADRGDLEPLVAAFAASQRRAFVQALGVSAHVLHATRAEQEVSAARERLVQREKAKRGEWERAKKSARRLEEIAVERLQTIADKLLEETKPLVPAAHYFVDHEPAEGPRGHYFRWQIIQTAKQLGYYANLTEYRAWTRLVMRTDSQVEILLSFHVASHDFRGLIAVSALLFRRDETEEGERQIADVTPLSSDIFQVNYLEAEPTVEARFRGWLEDALVRGLKIWRASL
jgi:Fic family protein